MRILFTTVALAGHFFPTVPLAWACRVGGHDVLVAGSEQFVPTALTSGLPVCSVGPSAGFVELVAETNPPAHQRQRQYANGRAFGRIATQLLDGMLDLVDTWHPDLVVSERAEFAGPIAAAIHGVPNVEVQWGVSELSEYREAGTVQLRERLDGLGLSGIPEPVRVYNPWPPSLRLAHARTHSSMRYVPYNGPARIPDWLLAPRRRPRVCLTMGTVVPRLPGEKSMDSIEPLLTELARLDVELLVAMDERNAEGWQLPDAVRHLGWLPLAQTLETCDVAIHHGGHGTTLTALSAACPQLVLPQFDDQFDNAQAVVDSGAGMQLPPGALDPDSAAKHCAMLLESDRFAEAAGRISNEMAAQPSPSGLLPALEELAS